MEFLHQECQCWIPSPPSRLGFWDWSCVPSAAEAATPVAPWGSSSLRPPGLGVLICHMDRWDQVTPSRLDPKALSGSGSQGLGGGRRTGSSGVGRAACPVAAAGTRGSGDRAGKWGACSPPSLLLTLTGCPSQPGLGTPDICSFHLHQLMFVRCPGPPGPGVTWGRPVRRGRGWAPLRQSLHMDCVLPREARACGGEEEREGDPNLLLSHVYFHSWLA